MSWRYKMVSKSIDIIGLMDEERIFINDVNDILSISSFKTDDNTMRCKISIKTKDLQYLTAMPYNQLIRLIKNAKKSTEPNVKQLNKFDILDID